MTCAVPQCCIVLSNTQHIGSSLLSLATVFYISTTFSFVFRSVCSITCNLYFWPYETLGSCDLVFCFVATRRGRGAIFRPNPPCQTLSQIFGIPQFLRRNHRPFHLLLNSPHNGPTSSVNHRVQIYSPSFQLPRHLLHELHLLSTHSHPLLTQHLHLRNLHHH